MCLHLCVCVCVCARARALCVFVSVLGTRSARLHTQPPQVLYVCVRVFACPYMSLLGTQLHLCSRICALTKDRTLSTGAPIDASNTPRDVSTAHPSQCATCGCKVFYLYMPDIGWSLCPIGTQSAVKHTSISRKDPCRCEKERAVTQDLMQTSAS